MQCLYKSCINVRKSDDLQLCRYASYSLLTYAFLSSKSKHLAQFISQQTDVATDLNNAHYECSNNTLSCIGDSRFKCENAAPCHHCKINLLHDNLNKSSLLTFSSALPPLHSLFTYLPKANKTCTVLTDVSS